MTRESRLQYRWLVWLTTLVSRTTISVWSRAIPAHSIGTILALDHIKHKLSMARPKSALPSARSRQHSSTSMKVGRDCSADLALWAWWYLGQMSEVLSFRPTENTPAGPRGRKVWRDCSVRNI